MGSMPCSRMTASSDSAAAEQTAVNLRVQGLDPSAHDFREPGVVGDFLDDYAVALQQLCRAAGGEQLDAALLQSARKFNYSSLV